MPAFFEHFWYNPRTQHFGLVMQHFGGSGALGRCVSKLREEKLPKQERHFRIPVG